MIRFCLLLVVTVLVGPLFLLPIAAQDEEADPPPVDDSPLQRRDTPPGDVLAQLNFGGAVRGDDGLDCRFNPAAAPSAVPVCVLEVAEDGALGFEGFVPGEAILVEVARPDGTVERTEVVANDEGRAQVPWTTAPGEPVGEHTVSASQGALEASGVFTVRAATEPQSVVLPRAAPPGTTFQVVLAGFPSGASVPLRLYRDIGDTFWYLTDLAPARVSERGEAVYELATRPDDPEGRYLVVTEPRVVGPAQLNGQFLVTRGGNSTAEDPSQTIADLAEAAVTEANRVWAAVLGDASRPATDLEHVFAGARLAEASAEVESLRASGQSRTVRLTAPVVIRSAQELSRFRIDAVATEMWEDQIINADGSLARDLSGPVNRHYMLEQRFEPCYCWFVVESAPVAS